MKILITNDDGIQALGLKLLVEWAKKLGEVTVVAPKTEQSGKSHAIEFKQPVEIKKVPFDGVTAAYAVDSTPADCVRFAFLGLKTTYDLVLSGINCGVNVGADVVYSGTVGAIFEASRLSVPSIAFSAFPDGQEEAAKYLDGVYAYIVDNNLFKETPIYNVNIPKNPQGLRMTYQGSPYFSDRFELVEGDMYMQAGEQISDACPDDLDRDTVAIHKNIISVTPLLATRTDLKVYEKYKTK